ncbi:hypothetical protein GE061_017252 [Apolygus lucorum]|uniref:CHK kinase-like domain-containing protein n=1 Tax=Apolygus lucorum TaxID=248454 RepID=A0A8S9XAL0_APOLU|nr:hypothetical protein GE061_017252 [Apolygus lucorum]
MGSQSEEAMELNAGWLESLLKRKAFEESPTRVVDFNIADGVGKWENYLSKIKRVSAKVALGSGRTRTVSLIIKDQHRTVYLKNMSQNNGYFFREIMMYRDIIPKMDDLLDEMKDDEGPLWAKCLGYRLYDQLVFEDLSASGHVVADRKQLMDLETSKFVVKSIARFHALSKVLLQRGEIPLDVFSESVWCKSETLERMIPKYTSNLVKAMETWGHEWKDAKERLAVSPQDVIEKFKKALKPEPTDFSVLTHGDCWTNNFLIRYDKESKEPRAMKFVDLQISSVAPCTYDLHYFLVTSVKPEVQQEHEELLLKCYSDSLKSNLMKFGFEGPIPAVAEVQATMDKTAVFRLVTSLLITPIVTGIHDDVPDLEEIIAEQVEAMAKGEPAPETWNVHEYKNEITKNLVQNSIKLAHDIPLPR